MDDLFEIVDQENGCFMLFQAITFDLGLFSLAFLAICGQTTVASSRSGPWIFFVMPSIYLVVQVVAILKLGFKKSFAFLRYALKPGKSGGPK